MLIVAVLLGAGLVASGYRAWDLQIHQHADLRAMAEEQYLKQVELPPSRGSIVDRNGKPLAVSVEVESVYADPHDVSDFVKTARRLAKILDLDAGKLQVKLARGKRFVWVKRRVDAAEALRVRDANLKGVHFVQETRRYYPGRELAATTIGFTNIDAVGIEGLELALQEELSGKRRFVSGLRDARGRELLVSGSPDTSSASGHDVVLTLDRRIQNVADQVLAAAVAEHKAKSGVAVLTDPRSGEVLALSSIPSYNPNEPHKARRGARRNRAVADQFEPGSTLKAFSIAAALDRGVIRAGDRFHCENGAYPIGEYVIHDHEKHGWLDVGGVMQHSSNIGAAKIGRRLGREGLHHYLERFGFGQRTGIELPGERRGILRPPTRWSEVGLANIAFGQGIAVTAVQLAAALGAIADGGKLHALRLVREVRDASGKPVPRTPPAPVQVISADTARRTTRLLERVVHPEGTGALAAIPGYRVAGKTGTAQKVDPVTGTYSSDAFVSSFVGFVPSDDPRLLAVIAIDEPQGKLHYGGQVAAPAFQEIAAEALRVLGVRPTGGNEKVAAKAPPPAPAGVADEVRAGGGFVTVREPPRAEGDAEVPDFTGMSLAEVLEIANRLGLRPVMEGSGRAVGQSPGPGPAPSGVTVRIVFSPPG